MKKRNISCHHAQLGSGGFLVQRVGLCNLDNLGCDEQILPLENSGLQAENTERGHKESQTIT